jgi:hypothetical protein
LDEQTLLHLDSLVGTSALVDPVEQPTGSDVFKLGG